MTLDQALHILLMYSANDAAMLIAENIGGSVDHFVEMMNEEAQRLGATNTSFTNPHGLSDDNHYTSAYDLYLIFNEAIKYDSFNEIIHMTSYQTAYYDKDGKAKELTVNNTNRFLRGDFQAPENPIRRNPYPTFRYHCGMFLQKALPLYPFVPSRLQH